jgi:hypothetical protein
LNEHLELLLTRPDRPRVNGLTPDFLVSTAVGVIGLWNMGITDEERVTRLAAYRNRDYVRGVIHAIRNCADPTVLKWVEHGLPAGASAPIYEGHVRCELCGSDVNMVPCPRCNMIGPAVPMKRRRQRTRPIPEPTTARPGTPEKMAVMRARLRAGRALSHPDDPVIEREWTWT